MVRFSFTRGPTLFVMVAYGFLALLLFVALGRGSYKAGRGSLAAGDVIPFREI